MKDYPKKGRRRIHALVAEKALGRPLQGKERVHHVNEDRRDYSNGNLVICPSDAYHALLHTRQAALTACGKPDWRKCYFCQSYDDPKKMRQDPRGKDSFHHLACAAEEMRYRRNKKKKATEDEKLCLDQIDKKLGFS